MTDPAKTQTDPLIQGARAGDKKAVARLFNLLEDRRPEKMAEAGRLLDELWRGSRLRGHVIGITGSPGAGKSCLVSALIRAIRAGGQTVGVIAIDPSSRSSKGALLGDRIRLEYDVADEGVFVRSMANRGETGGISDRTFAGTIALRAGFDVVIVETVGIGQSEADVTDIVDTTALVIQPASGDVLQFIKAGIMEEPHLFVVNKADLTEPARRAYNDVRSAMGLTDAGAPNAANAAHGADTGDTGDDGRECWAPHALLCSARTGEGIEELWAELQGHRRALGDGGNLENIRDRQAERWIERTLVQLYGERGAAQVSESAGGVAEDVGQAGGEGASEDRGAVGGAITAGGKGEVRRSPAQAEGSLDVGPFEKLDRSCAAIESLFKR